MPLCPQEGKIAGTEPNAHKKNVIVLAVPVSIRPSLSTLRGGQWRRPSIINRQSVIFMLPATG